MKYFRIENYDNELGESLSGFVGVISAMLLLSLGLPADVGDDEYNAALSVAKDKKPYIYVEDRILGYICDIKIPEIYKSNVSQYVCLYKEKEYQRVIKYLTYFGCRIMEFYDGSYKLICREMEIPDEEKVYEDEYQIVIPRKRYEKMTCINEFELTDRKSGTLNNDDVNKVMDHVFVNV